MYEIPVGFGSCFSLESRSYVLHKNYCGANGFVLTLYFSD